MLVGYINAKIGYQYLSDYSVPTDIFKNRDGDKDGKTI